MRRVVPSEGSNKKPRWRSNITNETTGWFGLVVWTVGVGEAGREVWAGSAATLCQQRSVRTVALLVSQVLVKFGKLETTILESGLEKKSGLERAKNTHLPVPANAPPTTPEARKRT